MPPKQRSRRSSSLLQPHNKGLLSRCRRNERRRRHVTTAQHGETERGVPIPDDALGRIFTGFLDVVSVVRCAATCRHWAGVISSDAAGISRALKPLGRRLPDLAVGFLHQENDDGPRSRTGRCAAEPTFLPTASGCRRFGVKQQRLVLSSLMNRLPHAGILHYSRPVASRNGRLVLELRRESRADGLAFCVCNPMTGDMAVLPELAGDDMPGLYACALLTGDDLDHAPGTPTFFRVLLVYNRRGFTALRCCSSDDDGRWGPEVRKTGDKISSEALRRLGPAVVVRGAVYWPLNHGAFGVRLGDDVSSVPLLGYPTDPYSGNRLLGVSPRGRLSYISALPCGGMLSVTVHLFPSDSDGDPAAGRLEWCGPPGIDFPQLNIDAAGDVKMRWFCEKSGIVFCTLGQGSTTPGTYALNLETKEVERLVDGEGFSWTSFCGYEIDLASYLAFLVR
ncbi:hypothetical protein QOZ80_2AG0111270 [Eleusine coracana subsp. coracana]|nr:hypothetical protein QOZ80_2AG0111270 [Eleusine coracana subsp. coracana]